MSFWLLFFVIYLAINSNEVFGTETCPVTHGPALITRSLSDSGSSTLINTGNPIPCSGFISGWRFIQSQTAELIALVFRPTPKSDGWIYYTVGRTVIPAQDVLDKVQEYKLSEPDWIPVLRGDIIGFHHSSGLLKHDDEDQTVATSQYLLKDGAETLTAFVTSETVWFSSDAVWRAYSLQALFTDFETPRFQVVRPPLQQCTDNTDLTRVWMNYWQPFKKRGVVTGWRFIAQRSRAVDVLILRPTADILTFQIIARKTVTFTSEDVGNEVEHVLQYSEQVYYLPGDMYGIWNGDGNDYVLLQTHTMFLNNVMYLRTETNEVLGSEDTHVTFTQRVQRYISFEPVVLGDHDPQLVFKLHVEQDYKLQSNSIETITNLNRIACISRCIQNELCKSINYNNGQMSCDLNNIAKDSDPSNYVSEIGQTYLEMEPKTMRSFSKCNVVDCGIGKMCEPSDNKEGYICRCISTGYVSDYCPVEECTGALGMQSGGILNDQISASSLYNCAACYAYCGRLHKNEGDVNSASACVSAWVTYPGANEWLKVDLLVEHNITGVVTQGRDITYDDQWVTHYTISYFEVDQVGETYITDGNGKIKVFDGNFHRDDPRAHYFHQTVRATAIKFHAREWKNYISMRVEILGCRFGHQWARVFKGISRNGLSIYDAWVSGTGASSYHAHRFLISNTHYRNVAIMNNWSSLSITKVRLTLYSEFNKELLLILFNGVGTTKDTWFARENVEYSPWSDLTTQSVNYFSIDGQSSNERRFFINSYYGGCAGDIGWLIVDEGTGCIEWQGYDSSPVILYSRATTRQNWYTGNIGVARAMTIDVKLGN